MPRASGADGITLTTNDQTIFTTATDGRAPLAIYISVRATSGKVALINIPGLHGNQYAKLDPGAGPIPFRLGAAKDFTGRIDNVKAKTVDGGGTCIIDMFVGADYQE